MDNFNHELTIFERKVIDCEKDIAVIKGKQNSIDEDIQEVKGDVKKILGILNNGLTTKVKETSKTLDNHIREHKENKEKKSALWLRPIAAGIVGSIFTLSTGVLLIIISGVLN